jgi:hypothetical protein
LPTTQGARLIDSTPPARQTGEQRRHPRHVAVVLARLVGGAEIDVGDLGRVDSGPLDYGADDVGGEIVWAHAGERTPVGAHRRADRVD